MKEIYLFNIGNICLNESTYNNLLNVVSSEKKERISRYRRYEDKLRSLFGEAVIRNVIAKKLLCSADEIEFEKNKYGKLKLKNSENLYFNISHSGNYAIACISDGEIGIDIEQYKDAQHEIIDLAKRYYTEEEYNWILSFDEENRVKAFYKIWTLKESYIKFVGRGLSISLKSFSFSYDNGNIYLKKENEVFKNIQFKVYNIEEQYMMSVCYELNNKDEDIKSEYVTLEQLKEDLNIN